MFGFRLKAKSEHEATQVFGWYGEGVWMVYPYLGVTERARDIRIAVARQAEVEGWAGAAEEWTRSGICAWGGRGNLCAARHVATKTVGAGIDGPSAGKGGCCDVCPNYRIAVKGQIPAAGMVGGAGARRAFVATWRLCEVCRRKSPFYQFSRLAIAPLVGEAPSGASALPNQAGRPLRRAESL